MPYVLDAQGRHQACARWQTENLCSVTIKGVAHQVHRRAHVALVELLMTWSAAGLLERVESWDRFYAWGTTGRHLGAHAHGAAFDVNTFANPNGRRAHDGPGGTLPLLPIARALGWWCGADWGGHFAPAARHFELTAPEGRG